MTTASREPSHHPLHSLGVPILPEWSGRFVELFAGFGIVVIDISDGRLHEWPEGWVSLREPVYLDCLEVWFLGRDGN